MSFIYVFSTPVHGVLVVITADRMRAAITQANSVVRGLCAPLATETSALYFITPTTGRGVYAGDLVAWGRRDMKTVDGWQPMYAAGSYPHPDAGIAEDVDFVRARAAMGTPYKFHSGGSYSTYDSVFKRFSEDVLLAHAAEADDRYPEQPDDVTRIGLEEDVAARTRLLSAALDGTNRLDIDGLDALNSRIAAAQSRLATPKGRV